MGRMQKTEVVFHENGKEYIWHIPSGWVFNAKREPIIKERCPNLPIARKKVRK